MKIIVIRAANVQLSQDAGVPVRKVSSKTSGSSIHFLAENLDVKYVCNVL